MLRRGDARPLERRRASSSPPASARWARPTKWPSSAMRDDIYHGAIRHGYQVERGWFTGGKLVLTLPDLPAEDAVAAAGVLAERGAPGGARARREDGAAPQRQRVPRARKASRGRCDFARGQQLMLFQGPAVLGYPAQLGRDGQAAQASTRCASAGWSSTSRTAGRSWPRASQPNIVRVHSIPPEEMQELHRRHARWCGWCAPCASATSAASTCARSCAAA